jgi:hypothetical protein
VVGELPNGATVESICVYKHDPRRDEESWVVLHLKAIS